MGRIVTFLICILMVSFSSISFAKKNGKTHSFSNHRALTAGKVESILTGKKFDSPRKGGYHVGSDVRYQPHTKDYEYSRFSGGKTAKGEYKIREIK